MRWGVGVAGVVLLLAGCSESDSGSGGASSDESSTGVPSTPTTATPTPASPTAPGTPTAPTSTPVRPPEAVRFDRDAAIRTVRHLAGQIGPREAASPAFRQAADWVAGRFAALGYDVDRRPVRVPAGVSWGVPVDAGRTWNLVTTTPDYEAGAPYLIVGAHLDTVPQAPGAEDNASGIAVLLELARMATESPSRLPVVFVAFGGEEPRGETDDDHHFGSRAYVAQMSTQQRRSLQGMVALDRVGVGSVVPACSGGMEPPIIRRELLRAAARNDISAEPCENQASDHWSFDKAGLPAARLGSTPYAEYHSEADLPPVVQPRQLARVGRVMWAWLTPGL